MRFRTRFGLLGWCWTALAFFYACIWFFRHGHATSSTASTLYLSTVVLWTIPALLRILSYFFIYWDLGPTSLTEHSFWKKKEVFWSEVTHVGGLVPGKPSSDSLRVDYARPAPMPEAGQLVAHPNPADRQQFIAALRGFAPQATFDV